MRKRIGAALAVLAVALVAAAGSPAYATTPKAPKGFHMPGTKRALTAFNGAGYYYAGGSQTLSGTDTAGGLTANVLVTKPFVPNTPKSGLYDHSLADLAVSATTSGPAGNAIEAFVAVEPNVWGDFNPHLGVCAWTGGVDVGCYTGGTTWVDYAPNATNLGADLTADIGTSKQLEILYASTGCGGRPTGWWVAYGGNWIGCYTDQTFSTSFTSAKFLQAFSEYEYNGVNNPGTSNDKPCGDMGKGGTPGTGQSYIASLSMLNQSPSTLVTSFTLFTPTDQPAYDANWTVPGSTTRSFYYGGAGYKFTAGVASTPGNVGSC